MTKLGELLGTMADKLAQDSLNIGDVHFLNLDSTYYQYRKRKSNGK